MKFSRAAGYAIVACAQLSHAPDAAPIPCSRLAQVGDMPDRFLLQIMRNLVAAGICTSTRGVDGGYRLTRPASRVTLADVVEAIDGPLDQDLLDEPIDGLALQSNRLVAETLKGIARTHRKRLADLLLSSMKVEQPQLASAG